VVVEKPKPTKGGPSRFAQFKAKMANTAAIVETGDIAIEIKVTEQPKTPVGQLQSATNMDTDELGSIQKQLAKSGRRRKSAKMLAAEQPKKYGSSFFV
jgi:hypothetical protein